MKKEEEKEELINFKVLKLRYYFIANLAIYVAFKFSEILVIEDSEVARLDPKHWSCSLGRGAKILLKGIFINNFTEGLNGEKKGLFIIILSYKPR